MDETDDNMSADDVNVVDSASPVKVKPKKRSLVERELETSLTASITSPITYGDTSVTSRYGRARRVKVESDGTNPETVTQMKSPAYEKTPVKVQSPVYKMHASNSPIKTEPKETPKKLIPSDSSLDNQIENIYHENISLSRFGSDDKTSPGSKYPKVYVRKDLIQNRDKDENVVLIKNMFSPVQSPYKSANSHLNNILERSSEKYHLNSVQKSHNGYLNTSSVVKTLDFDNNKKKKKENRDIKGALSKSDLFDIEAKCDYQVGDLAWARMGTYPFWPCIVTREPGSGMFVKKKMFGRIERDVVHVTFFGDNGRRSWIVDTMLRKFLGQLEFEATRSQFSPSDKKRDPKLYAAYFVSEKKMQLWSLSVEEAETLLREPKRLRIDILNDMLANYRVSKKTQKSSKVTRTASDVSLSESLFDTLFSEDDAKAEDHEKSRSKTKKSLDVSEVVTACLDNMAAKTGITKIQRQSHMDRWLQKAKSKTPEKLQNKVTPQKKENVVKVISSKKKKKISPTVPIKKPYSFRNAMHESQYLKSHHNEHDYSSKVTSTPQKSDQVDSILDKENKDEAHLTKDIDVSIIHSDSVDTKENLPDSTGICPVISADETIDEIQVNICSVEENAELEKCLSIDQVIDNFSLDATSAKDTVTSTELKSKEVDSDHIIMKTDDHLKSADSENKSDSSQSPSKSIQTKKYRLLRSTRRTQIESELQLKDTSMEAKEKKTSLPELELDKGNETEDIVNKSEALEQSYSEKSNDEQIINKKDSLRRHTRSSQITEVAENKDNQIDSPKKSHLKSSTQNESVICDPHKRTESMPADDTVTPIVQKDLKDSSLPDVVKNAEEKELKSPVTPLKTRNLRLRRNTTNACASPDARHKDVSVQENKEVSKNTEEIKPDQKEEDTQLNNQNFDKYVKNTETCMQDQNLETNSDIPVLNVRLRSNRYSKKEQNASNIQLEQPHKPPKNELKETREKQNDSMSDIQVTNETVMESEKTVEHLNTLTKTKETELGDQNQSIPEQPEKAVENNLAVLEESTSFKSPERKSNMKLRLKRQASSPQIAVENESKKQKTSLEGRKTESPLPESDTSVELTQEMKEIDQIESKPDKLESEKAAADTKTGLENNLPKTPVSNKKIRLRRNNKTPPVAAADNSKIKHSLSEEQNDIVLDKTLETEQSSTEITDAEAAKLLENITEDNNTSLEPTQETKEIDQIKTKPEKIEPEKAVDNTETGIKNNLPKTPVSNKKLRLKRNYKTPQAAAGANSKRKQSLVEEQDSVLDKTLETEQFSTENTDPEARKLLENTTEDKGDNLNNLPLTGPSESTQLKESSTVLDDQISPDSNIPISIVTSRSKRVVKKTQKALESEIQNLKKPLLPVIEQNQNKSTKSKKSLVPVKEQVQNKSSNTKKPTSEENQNKSSKSEISKNETQPQKKVDSPVVVKTPEVLTKPDLPVIPSPQLEDTDFDKPKTYYKVRMNKQTKREFIPSEPKKKLSQEEYNEKMKSLQSVLEESQKELCILLETDNSFEETQVLEEIIKTEQQASNKEESNKSTKPKKVPKVVKKPKKTVQEVVLDDKSKNIKPTTSRSLRLQRRSKVSDTTTENENEKKKKPDMKKARKPSKLSRKSDLNDSTQLSDTEIQAKETLDDQKESSEITENKAIDESMSAEETVEESLNLSESLLCDKTIDNDIFTFETSVEIESEQSSLANENQIKTIYSKQQVEMESSEITENKAIDESMSAEETGEEFLNLSESLLCDKTIDNDIFTFETSVEIESEQSSLANENQIKTIHSKQQVEKEINKVEKPTMTNKNQSITETENEHLNESVVFEKQVGTGSDTIEHPTMPELHSEEPSKTNDNQIVDPNTDCIKETTNSVKEVETASDTIEEPTITEEIQKVDTLVENQVNTELDTEEPIITSDNQIVDPQTDCIKETINSVKQVETETDGTERLQTESTEQSIMMNINDTQTDLFETIVSKDTVDFQPVETSLITSINEKENEKDREIAPSVLGSEIAKSTDSKKEEDIEYGHLEFLEKRIIQAASLEHQNCVQSNQTMNTQKNSIENNVSSIEPADKEYDHLDFIFSSCPIDILENSNSNTMTDVTHDQNKNDLKSIVNSESLKETKSTEILPDISPPDKTSIVNEIKNNKSKQSELRVNIERIPIKNYLYKTKYINDNGIKNYVSKSDAEKTELNNFSVDNNKSNLVNVVMIGTSCNEVDDEELDEKLLLQEDSFDKVDDTLPTCDFDSGNDGYVNTNDTKKYLSSFSEDVTKRDDRQRACDTNIEHAEPVLDQVDAVSNSIDDVVDEKIISAASEESKPEKCTTVSKDETESQDTRTTDEVTTVENSAEDGINVTEFVSSVNKLSEPVKVNGFHADEIDFSDGEFNAETSSINSEDSEPLAITKSKLILKNQKKAKKALEDPEFVKYLEMRQDQIMDEHPELSQDEIVEYLYKTWQYEENSKSDFEKNFDIELSGLVKGLKQNLRKKTIRNNFRESKKRNKKRDDDTWSISSDVSDTSVKKRLRTRATKSPVTYAEDSENSSYKGMSREVKSELMDNISINSDVSIASVKCTSSTDKSSITSALENETHQNDKEPSSHVSKDQVKELNTTSQAKEKTKSPKNKETSIKDYFKVANQNNTNQIEEKDDLNNVNTEIKEEYDPETASINSEDSQVSLSKRKPRKLVEKNNKSTNDPEFLKYVELRQDILIDENPQLTQEEIVSYLYKTWLYEESVKSDIKKSDDLEQANLVKGLNPDTPQTKKGRRKVKTEKEYTLDEEVLPKEKPKRKISQPYYNEDLSDIEDEIQLFEIFKPKHKLNMLTADGQDVDQTGLDQEVIEIDEVDEVEHYFAQLTQSKPNVFKGLAREKVCDICEITGNLVKCKGCNSMFHPECVKKKAEVYEEPAPPTRGRKKKKPGRKPKNFEDSGSHSDEKSLDVSEEMNVSVEEIPLPVKTVNADDFEAVLAAKMQELIPTVDANYDSYSSDDGPDWNSAPPGKCEIVDVKLKPKVVIDYSNFKCNDCQVHSTPVCFVCKSAKSKNSVELRQKCQTAHCKKYYHLECLDHWPQTQFQSGEPSKTNKKINEHFEALMCPRHVCHTCVSDDPRGCKTRFLGDKLARCVRCPATYHTFNKCLPAGTQILTGSLIVCPRHYEHRPGKVPCHVNTGWCFICALGGSLICCEYCPTSFHAECLNIKPPEGGYMCEDCETGRLPLYGEMVWVKLGHYRWWPGIILHPSEIPENIMAVKHSQGEFVVRFFGQYDHYWVNRGRVFPFQEGDSGKTSGQKSKIDADFTTAMEHAQRAFEILKTAVPDEEESQDIASSLLPPHYVKLKVNKPCGSLCGKRIDIEESSLTQCECDPADDDPCGPYSHCLNRMLLTECGPICRAGERCSNRAFEKRLYPKLVPYRTPHRGWGLKTLEDIKAGQFVIEYVGELIDEEEFRRRMNRKHEIRDENFYFLTLDKERMIDAGPKGNLARFMNHCCEPNCETQKWTVLGDVRVGLFALYDIPANSELTFNYNLECAGIEKKQCMCGARRCSGYIGAKPKQEETQSKKNKLPGKRTYKKRKNIEISPKPVKPKRPVGRPAKPKELTEIEKDLLIIKNATNGLSSDSEGSGRLSSVDSERYPKALKRKRDSISTDECGSTTTNKRKRDSISTEDSISSGSSKKKSNLVSEENGSSSVLKSKRDSLPEESDSSSSLKRKRDSIVEESSKKVKVDESKEVGD